MKFCDIPGHEHAKERLRSMADSGRLPHALLLEGPAGIGKLALARAFAQYIHCTARTPDGEPCGVCPQCVQHSTFNHIDTIFSFPVVKPGRSTAVSAYSLPDHRPFLAQAPLAHFGRWPFILGYPLGPPQSVAQVIQQPISRVR